MSQKVKTILNFSFRTTIVISILFVLRSFGYSASEDPNISKGTNCDVTEITPQKTIFPAAGGIGGINVKAPEGCSWYASQYCSDCLWYGFWDGMEGKGNGTITYWVAENVFERKRSGKIRVSSIPSGKSKIHRIVQQSANWEDWHVLTLDAGPRKAKYGRAGRSTSIALDSNDKVHIAYYSDSEDAVKYVTNVNNRWETLVIDRRIDRLPDITIGVDNSNKIHIIYNKCNRRWDNWCDDDLYYATNKSGLWQIQPVDSAKAVGQYSSMAIDTTGQLHVAYSESEAGYSGYGQARLKYARQTEGSWVSEIVNSSSNLFATMIHLRLDYNGKAHISYMDYNTRNLWYSTNASGQWESTELHERTGQYNAIAIDTSGKVHIFHSPQDWGLWYTTNATGNWKTELVRSDANWFNSVAIDLDNVIHISSFDAFNGVLKYMKVENGAWERCYVDTQVDSGRYNDIALDTQGNVHISYHFWSFKNGLDIGSLRYATNLKKN